MINIPVRTVTQLAAESVLSAAGRDMISRAVHAPYAAPVAVAIHAVAPAPLIPRPPASSPIGLRDCLVLDELLMAETSACTYFTGKLVSQELCLFYGLSPTYLGECV